MIPEELRPLFWDVDPTTLDLAEHRDYILERVMVRGGWTAMTWLQSKFTREILRELVERKWSRLPPRERAYWALVTGANAPAGQGGGRPQWAGP